MQKAFASYYSKRRRTTSISHLQYDLKVVEKAEGGAAAAGLDAPSPPLPMEENRGSSAYLLSRVYSFAFICCVASQLGPLMVTLAVAVCPAVFPPHLRAAWAVTEVFAPPPFYTSETMRSMGAAMHGFFQYDQYVGSTAAVIWASALYVNSRRTPLNGKGWVRFGGRPSEVLAGRADAACDDQRLAGSGESVAVRVHDRELRGSYGVDAAGRKEVLPVRDVDDAVGIRGRLFEFFEIL